jgi:5-methyltetrahydropteroyltriglutamate--homocysteine methyltransferase
MARGYQKDGLDITAMEMTKWFDTNYHYIVPEFYKNQQFKLTQIKFSMNLQEQNKQESMQSLLSSVCFLFLLGKKKKKDLINWIWLKSSSCLY